MGMYRKKRVVVEAKQWDGNNTGEILAFGGMNLFFTNLYGEGKICIKTLEGTMTASYDDWIIKGINGEFYPCKPDIFDASYDPLD